MRVLVINCGSSTLKFDLIALEAEEGAVTQEQRVASGVIDRIGALGSLQFRIESGDTIREPVQLSDYRAAIQEALRRLHTSGVLDQGGIEAVGHRVVHGGERFFSPALIDDEVLGGIEQVSHFAPLHNGPALMAIRATRTAIGAATPMVAVFDTAYHRTMPPRAAQYAISHELAEKHQVWRYGFHGIAHRYMAERYAFLTGAACERTKLITLQLGSGCSATAIVGGCSVDTSMGLTPLEGLVMGTRSGDVDPSLVGFLAQREGVGVEEVEDQLNRQSGLLGISGRSKDMRDLLEAEAQGDPKAALAVEMFSYRVRKYIGAYMAVLGGADAVVFGGGIGENAPAVRARICDGMDWCGLSLDKARNERVIASESRISAEGAGVEIYVIPVDEAVMIARDTLRCV